MSVLQALITGLVLNFVAPSSAEPTTAPAIQVVFMEPAGFQLYRRVTDPERLAKYDRWLANESARRALDLYARAVAQNTSNDTTLSRQQPAPSAPRPYYIALIPGGNHADAGFRLQTDAGIEEHLQTPYIKLDADPEVFATTMLHETGHMILAALNGDDGIPRRPLAAIPHTTAALSDRGTAFDEGFAIHLETLAAHLTRDPELRARYHHESVRLGTSHPKQRSEYARHAADLLSYSQNLARYSEVRENCYAFAPACRDPDYLRVQLDPARDFATLRDAGQLLQSEGFYASFFFALTFRGEGLPDEPTLHARQDRIFAALRETLSACRSESDTADSSADPDTPWLLRFVQTYMRLYPDEAGDAADVLLDLSRGVFVDAEAAPLWREFYTAALRLDLENLPRDKVKAARERWRAAVLSGPQILFSRIGPQLACRVPVVKVRLAALKQESPLAFDLNTAEEGVLRLIPDLNPDELALWLAERAKSPFTSVADFNARVPLRPSVLKQLQFP